MADRRRRVRAAMRFDFSPEGKLIGRTSKYVCDFYSAVLADPDASARVMLAAHELLENAAKYATGGRALLRFSTRLDGDHALVNLSLINDTSAGHIDQLRQRVNAIVNAPDAFMHYQQLMLAPARSPGESGLGLARIAAEAEMQLGLEVKANTVAIMATAKVDMGARYR